MLFLSTFLFQFCFQDINMLYPLCADTAEQQAVQVKNHFHVSDSDSLQTKTCLFIISAHNYFFS